MLVCNATEEIMEIWMGNVSDQSPEVRIVLKPKEVRNIYIPEYFTGFQISMKDDNQTASTAVCSVQTDVRRYLENDKQTN